MENKSIYEATEFLSRVSTTAHENRESFERYEAVDADYDYGALYEKLWRRSLDAEPPGVAPLLAAISAWIRVGVKPFNLFFRSVSSSAL